MPASAAGATVERFHAAVEAALGRALVPDERIALAVSGGPDSMAMLALAAAAYPGQVAAATVDHGLRAGAAAEAAMVAVHAATLGVPHVVLHPAAPISGSSIQMRARQARYALLAGWVRDVGAVALLTAHHRDDQAETFLMRAARGSGVAGLAGIRASQPLPGGEPDCRLLRPLLGWSRAELRAFATGQGVPFVDEPSNSDDRHDRTRFRKLLAAQSLLAPDALADSARHVGEVEETLAALAGLFWDERQCEAGTGTVAIDMTGLPREMRRRLARRAIHAVRAEQQVDSPDFSDSTNIESLLDALARGRGATQGGVMAISKGAIWNFRKAPPRRSH